MDPQCNNNKDEGKAKNMCPTDKVLEQAGLNGGGFIHLLFHCYHIVIIIEF